MVAVAQSQPHKLRRGDRLGGKYVLRRRVAIGGMGEIWVAHNDMTEAEVALKVMRGDVDERLRVEPRFRHEAKLGATLSHRNIIRVFDLIEEQDGALVLVMELLRGETLLRLLRRRKTLTTQEAAAILIPILGALRHAHEMGVVHRDVKPPNIFLAVDPDGHITPKLIDFGIAKLPGGVHTADDRILGTPRYMSPEQIRADPRLDGRSDLFSVGVLLVEMLTGSCPFECETPSASLAAVLENRVDPDPRIDPKLWLVVQRALAKRAYERFADAAEFATAFRQAVGESDTALAAHLHRGKPPPSLASVRAALGSDAGEKTAASPPPPSSHEEYDDGEESIDSISIESPPATAIPIPRPAARLRGRGALIAAGAIVVGVTLAIGAASLLVRHPVAPQSTLAATDLPSTPAVPAASVAPAPAESAAAAPATAAVAVAPEHADPHRRGAGAATAAPPRRVPRPATPPPRKPVAQTPGF